MTIGGLQPMTLMDYPQKVSAIIFTSGCNMRCPFCYNPDLVVPELIKKADQLDEEKVMDFLVKRKKYLDGVCITGGEPLMQLEIVDLIKKIKKLGYLIKIDTNGLTPLVIQEVLDKKLVDYIAMDIKGPLDDYKKFCGVGIKPATIKESIGLVMGSGVPYEFRSTVVNGLHKKSDISKMAYDIAGAKKFYLQNFNRPGKLVADVFTGKGFTKKEMEAMRDLASKEVEKCIIR